MTLNITPGAFGIRPRVEKPNPQFLAQLTEPGMRELVSQHYDLLVKSKIKGLFPDNEAGIDFAKKKSADFFIQICGGEAHFSKNRGNPMMAARHAPFKITPSARLVWLKCYQAILPELKVDEPLLLSFWNYLDIFSIWMINTPEGEGETKKAENKTGFWGA